MRHAIKRDSDGLIVNVINLPSEANFSPPAGHSLISEAIQPMEIGGTFIANVYTPPVVNPGPSTARADSFKADAGRIDLLNRLMTATPAQIDTWIDANVTTLPQARTVLKAIVKVIALDART